MATPIVITPPVDSPVTLAQVKQHLRVDFADDDSYLTGLLIPAATQKAQTHIWGAIMSQTLQLSIDKFTPSQCIELSSPPMQSITSINYIDTEGVEQTIPTSDYKLFEEDGLYYIAEEWAKEWPESRAEKNAIKITYQAGYASIDDVPAPIKQAILLLIGHLYENREENLVVGSIQTLPFGFKELLEDYCVGKRL